MTGSLALVSPLNCLSKLLGGIGHVLLLHNVWLEAIHILYLPPQPTDQAEDQWTAHLEQGRQHAVASKLQLEP